MSFSQHLSPAQQQTYPGFQNHLAFNTAPFEQYSHASLPSAAQLPQVAPQWTSAQFPSQLQAQTQSFRSPSQPQLPTQSFKFSSHPQQPSHTFNFSAQPQLPPQPTQSNKFSAQPQLPTQSSLQNNDLSAKWSAAASASSSAASQFQQPGLSFSGLQLPAQFSFGQYSQFPAGQSYYGGF